MKAVYEGYGKDFTQVDWDTPDWEMLSKLTQNVFQFSSAKCYQELNDITQLLKDENGRLREFNDFKEAVEQLDVKYNRTWLETEYNTAVGSATTAARWTEFRKEKKYFPILQYQTVGDDKVRQDHAVLNGVKKHLDNEFWKTYYPPNGWNCRCEAIQLPDAEAKETPEELIKLPGVQSMFRTNLAESGLIFPKGHPYYNGVPEDVVRRSLQYIPEKAAYKIETTESGKSYSEHILLQWDKEAHKSRKGAKILCENGFTDVKLFPQIHAKEPAAREKIYGKSYAKKHPTKCPDGFAGGEPIEIKEAGRKKMSLRVLKASEQADVVLLICKNNLTQNKVERFVNGQWNLDDRKNIKKIMIFNNEKLQIFTRPKKAKAK
ncbi:MAG: phage head morphogenesis protein [Bacteroidales bacterium]|jgi:SPP1 gp7 family putative phage head morphogenesis protein|nr:phage head morphogenesis protein [Bacteroidales bacterium]